MLYIWSYHTMLQTKQERNLEADGALNHPPAGVGIT